MAGIFPRSLITNETNRMRKLETAMTEIEGVGGGDSSGRVFVIIIFFESFGARVDGQEWRANIKLERFLEYIVEISRKSGLCSANSNLI